MLNSANGGKNGKLEAVNYLKEYWLVSAEKSSYLIEMIEMPIMISYRTIYSESYHLTKGYVNKENPEKQFEKLLTENILPPELL